MSVRQRPQTPVYSVSTSPETRMPSCTDSSRTSTTTGSPSATATRPSPHFGGGRDLERVLAHLAGVVDDVTHVDAEGTWPASSHEDHMLPARR